VACPSGRSIPGPDWGLRDSLSPAEPDIIARVPAVNRCAGTLTILLAGLALSGSCGGSPARPTPQPPVATPPPSSTPPPPPNAAPVITRLSAQGTRRHEPANLADANEEIVLTATVTDAETAADKLTFEWSSPSGSFTGAGPSVRWRAPASVPTPLVATLQLRVVDGDQRVDRTVLVQVHDHVREVGDMATLFLRDFSDSTIPAGTVMRNFLPGCYGTGEETREVQDNRIGFRITKSMVGPPAVSVDFDGVCRYENRAGDACSVSPVRWESVTPSGGHDAVAGVDQIAAVYRQDRWWLCDSKFDGHPVSGTALFRSLTGGAR
jgi:hypothetical protein